MLGRDQESRAPGLCVSLEGSVPQPWPDFLQVSLEPPPHLPQAAQPGSHLMLLEA